MIKRSVGCIGYGSMGSMLLRCFTDSNMMQESDLFIATRTKEKLAKVDNKVIICNSNIELVNQCDLIFLCVKPYDVRNLLVEIKDYLTIDKHLVSIAGSVSIENIQKIFKGKISRVLPTFNSEIKEGVTLVCHNSNVLAEDKNVLECLLSEIGSVKNIPEEEFELLADLTSCAPGLIAAIFKEYCEAIIKRSKLERKEIVDMFVKTLYGTSKLFYEFDCNFDYVIARVATKGGATDAGVKVLKKKLPVVLKGMVECTLEKQYSRKKTIEEQFDHL